MSTVMKIIIFVYFLFYLIEDVSCNDGLLAKFHQKGYKLKDIRTQLISFDKNYFEFLQIPTFKFNRTTTAHNITFRAKINLYDKMEALVQGFKFLSNEYRHFPLRFQANLNKAFEANVAGVLNLKNCGNLTSFYFYKDVTYHACNYVVDETYLPPLIPNGRFKIELNLMYLNHPIAELYCFAEVYTPIDYKRT